MAESDDSQKTEDPTGEEPALEFDGTNTDQLDDSYRMSIALASENGSEVAARLSWSSSSTGRK